MKKKQCNYLDRIISIPGVVGGKPVVKGTRIPVEIVLQHLAYDLSLETLFAAYPQLTQDDIKACLLFYHNLLKQEGKRQTTARTLTHADRQRGSTQEALSLAGAWSDLPSGHMEEELDQIRHTSTPTLPFTFGL